MNLQMTTKQFEWLTRELREELPMWVVYRKWLTREFPGFWIARMHLTLPEPRPTPFVLYRETLEELRDALPRGLSFMPRSEGDVIEIQEMWL